MDFFDSPAPTAQISIPWYEKDIGREAFGPTGTFEGQSWEYLRGRFLEPLIFLRGIDNALEIRQNMLKQYCESIIGAQHIWSDVDIVLTHFPFEEQPLANRIKMLNNYLTEKYEHMTPLEESFRSLVVEYGNTTPPNQH
jgi:hypothetical protein